MTKAKLNTGDNRNRNRRAGFEDAQAGREFGANNHFKGRHPELDAAYQDGWDNYQRTRASHRTTKERRHA